MLPAALFLTGLLGFEDQSGIRQGAVLQKHPVREGWNALCQPARYGARGWKCLWHVDGLNAAQ